jgi:hypothetical protein
VPPFRAAASCDFVTGVWTHLIAKGWFACPDNLPVALIDSDPFTFAAIAAFFGLSNRPANVTNMRQNSEFYALGR